MLQLCENLFLLLLAKFYLCNMRKDGEGCLLNDTVLVSDPLKSVRYTPVQVFSSDQLMANQTSLHMWDRTYVHQTPKVLSFRNNCIINPLISLPLFLSQGQGNLKTAHEGTPLTPMAVHWLTKDFIHKTLAPGTPLHYCKSLHMLPHTDT